MGRDLLIHSMAEFAPITLPLLEAVNAKVVCEIGAEHGGNSKKLYEWLKQRNGKLLSIDPKPSADFLNWIPSVSDVVQHIAIPSHAAIPQVKTADAWFIDGDHNWYTVFNELMLIREHARKENRPLLIFLHDVGWPWARRDLYYSPDSIPENFRQPFTWEGGVDIDTNEIINGGFRGNGAYAIAVTEGGPKNGVMTAVDDFTKQYPGELCFGFVPAVFGLGVLFDLSHPHANLIATLIAPFHNNALLQALETNRLANYLAVIRWQDRANGSQPSRPAPAAPVQHQMPAQAAQTQLQPPSQPQQQQPQQIVAQQPANSPSSNNPNLLALFEQHAVNLINYISENESNAEMWRVVDSQLNLEPNALKQFADYLSMLLTIPQNSEALKFIGVLEAICIARSGNAGVAQQKFQQLANKYPNSPLIIGAYHYASAATEEIK